MPQEYTQALEGFLLVVGELLRAEHTSSLEVTGSENELLRRRNKHQKPNGTWDMNGPTSNAQDISSSNSSILSVRRSGVPSQQRLYDRNMGYSRAGRVLANC
jgi:hypothetical protein